MTAAIGICGIGARTANAGSVPLVSGTIQSSMIDSTTYDYTLTLSDSAMNANPVGTFWLSWVPGENFLPTSPLTTTSPSGWSDMITHDPSNGYAILWTSGSPAASLASGKSLTGFSFTSKDTPAMIFGNSPFAPTIPVLTATSYSAGPFSDGGIQFVVTGASKSVPLPPAVWSGLITMAGLAFAMKIRRRVPVA